MPTDHLMKYLFGSMYWIPSTSTDEYTQARDGQIYISVERPSSSGDHLSNFL